MVGKKVKTTLYLDKEVVEKAKEIGLNLSKVCENALIASIEAMEGVYGRKEPKIHPIVDQENKKVDRAGFEPATSDLRSRHSYR